MQFEEFEALMKDAAVQRKLLGLPKSMGFIPNSLAAHIRRVGPHHYEMKYWEYFEYLPEEVRRSICEDTVQRLRQIWPQFQLQATKTGVKMTMTGPIEVVIAALLMELFLLEDKELSTLRALLESLSRAQNVLKLNHEYYCNWNPEIAQKWKTTTQTYQQLKQLFGIK